MKNVISVSFLLVFFIKAAWSQSEGITATQIVTIEIKKIAQISVSGNPAPLIIYNAVAGDELTAVSDASTSYNIVTNYDNLKIVASINNKLPTGTTLKINLASSNAKSLGIVADIGYK